MNYLQTIKEKSPLIYNITNEVATNFTANGLIALGASPIMSSHPEEAQEIVERASAVVINTGMLTEEKMKAMLIAGKTANLLKVPVVLDPVAVGATSLRNHLIEKLLTEIEFTAICGNSGELAVLGEFLAETNSPDNALDVNKPENVKAVAEKYGTIAVSTSEVDVISDGADTLLCHNGDAILKNITASGCLLTSVLASFIAVARQDNYMEAASQAVSAYGIAAEIAKRRSQGPGTFLPNFLDELYLLTDRKMVDYGKLDKVIQE